MEFLTTHLNVFVILWWTKVIGTWSNGAPIHTPHPGSPLSDHEYKDFVKLIQPKVKRLCEIRQTFGCKDPRVQHFDLYENHGQIPTGPVCTEMNTFPNFSSFCQFATFRCSKHKFYVKRIPCSDDFLDVSQLSLATQSFTVTAHPSAPLSNDSATSLHQRIVTPEGTTSVSHIIPQRSHGVPDPLRSHIDRLLVLSFVVSGQEPIRRFQYNGSKKNVGSRHLSKAADSLTHEEQIRKTLQDAVALLRVLHEHKKHSAVQKEQVISDQESGTVSVSKWANKTTSEYDTEEEPEDTAVSDSKRGEKQHLTAVSDYDEGKLPDNEAITDSDAGQRLEGTPAADDVTGNLLDSNTIYGYDTEAKLDIREK